VPSPTGDDPADDTHSVGGSQLATPSEPGGGRLGDTLVGAGASGGDDELPRGTSIGRYVLLERLGVGGMGMVYAAFDPELDRKVAVKVLRANLGRNKEQFRARMQREAQAMARLQHPNVIAVYDVGTYGERVFLAMELVEGGTLKQWLRRDKPPLGAVMAAFLEAGRGLAAAHAAGLVHRDFKPENVLIGRDGRTRVTDFGLARSASSREDAPSDESRKAATPAAGSDGEREKTTRKIGLLTPSQLSEPDDTSEAQAAPASVELRDRASLDAALTRAGTVMGTPGYMAPEQCRGEATDARSDQFSYCASLYEAVYGHRAFPGMNAEEIMENVVTGKVREAPADTRVPAWIRGSDASSCAG
jgi:serine/threonine protein kinase